MATGHAAAMARYDFTMASSVLLAACISHSIPAASWAASATPKTGEPTVWLVDINGRPDIEVFARTNGKLVYLPQALLQEAGIVTQAPFPALLPFDDGMYFLPDQIEGAKVNADFDQQKYHLHVPPERLKAQTIDLSPAKILPLSPEPPWSAYFDYSYSETRARGNLARQGSLSSHLRLFGWSLYDDHVFQNSGSGFLKQRIQTAAFHDWPAQALRLSLGDNTIDTAELGRATPFFGLRLQRNYNLQPGFISDQTATLSGVAATPSTADIYMDGVLTATTNLGAGPFNLQNLRDYGGLRNIQVVVRDASGAQKTYSLPFYFTNNLLRKGIDDFDIGTGQQRQGYGSGSYGGLAASGQYRYGLSDDMTVGLRGNSVPGDQRLSPLLTARLGTVAVATLIAATRWHDGQRYSAQELNLSAQQRGTTLRAQWRATSNGFDDAPPASPGVQLLPDIRAHDALSLGWDQNLGALGYFSTVATRRWRFDGKMEADASISWSHKLPGRGTLQVGALTTFGDTTRQRSLFISASFALGERSYINGGLRKNQDSPPQYYLQAAQNIASDGGFGYRLYGSEQAGNKDQEAEFNWQAKWLELSGSARSANTGSTSYEAQRLQVSGALATVGGEIRAAPFIREAFAVASVGYPDVRVYRSGQMIGRTDAGGSILIPQLAPYADTTIAIEADDLPLDVDLLAPQLEAVPADGAGLLLKFALPKIAAMSGNLRRTDGPVKNRSIEITGPDGKTSMSRTGSDGFFELDGIRAGSYRLRVAGSCHATVAVPPDAPAIFQTGDVHCEDE